MPYFDPVAFSVCLSATHPVILYSMYSNTIKADILHANPVNSHVFTMDVKQWKSVPHYNLWCEHGTHFAGSEDSPDWDMDQSQFSVCQQGELMGSPWFSHVRQRNTFALALALQSQAFSF